MKHRCLITTTRNIPGQILSISLQGSIIPIVVVLIRMTDCCLVGTSSNGSIIKIDICNIVSIQFLTALPTTGLTGLTGIDAVNDAQTVPDLQASLSDPSLGLDLTGYNSLTQAQQDQAAAVLLASRPAEGFTDAASLQTALDAAVLQIALEEVNAAVSDAAIRTAIERAALRLDLLAYNLLIDAERTIVAQAVLAARPAEGYPTRSSVQAALDAAIPQGFLLGVNTAATAAEVRAAIEQTALGLDLSIYNTLIDAEKDAAAQSVLENRPIEGYPDLPSLQAALDAAISANALQKVILASSDAEVRSAIEHPALSLDLTSYKKLTEDQQNKIIQMTMAITPAKGFGTKEELQIYFNSALKQVMNSK